MFLATCETCESKFKCPKDLQDEYELFLQTLPDPDPDVAQKAKIEFVVDKGWCIKCRSSQHKTKSHGSKK